MILLTARTNSNSLLPCLGLKGSEQWISQKCQELFEHMISKTDGPPFFFSGPDLGPIFLIISFIHLVSKWANTFKGIWALGLNILWALTKFWGILAHLISSPAQGLRASSLQFTSPLEFNAIFRDGFPLRLDLNAGSKTRDPVTAKFKHARVL